MVLQNCLTPRKFQFVFYQTWIQYDILATWAEVIFRVKWIVSVSRWCYKVGPLNVIGQFQWFQNKPATAGVPPATWLYVAGYSGHNSLLLTNNLCVASYYNFTLNFAAIIHTQKDVSVVSCSKKNSSHPLHPVPYPFVFCF